MIGMYQYKNIYDKMLDVQNLECQERVDCIVDNYKTDVDWKWLIDLMSTKPDYKIDYDQEIENDDVDPSFNGIFGGLNEMYLNQKGLSPFNESFGDLNGNNLINKFGLSYLKQIVGDREKVVEFIRNMAYFEEQLFMIDIFNSGSEWFEESIFDTIKKL